MPFRKLLIANRGEIAVRIIRACRELGIRTVAVYSDVDRASLHVRLADEAARIGPAPSAESYLRTDRIVAAAREHGAEAVHPGYGFLSENAEFAAACEQAGLIFVGPPSSAIRLMGSKTEARRVAKEQLVPVLPGTPEGVSDAAEAARIAGEIGYPVLIKAAAGGGGKGMRRVDSPEDLSSAIRDASSEAERSFRNGTVYIEKLLVNPRHIEIQVLGDQHGHMIHLGERECSIQRRHQKLIEESPSPLMQRYPDLRSQMGQAAVRVARAAGYWNAGTVEFLVGEHGNFYFLEMNTRLQVEHPVTEFVTGVDMVHCQLRIAAGERLTLEQNQIRWHGCAIECRLYAEDPDQEFFPSPGEISSLSLPSGPGIRVDSGVYAGWTVPMDYDPLLAKLIAHADTREAATVRLRRAISESYVGGIATNLPFFYELLGDSEFQAANLHTGFIEEWSRRRATTSATSGGEAVAALAAVAHAARTAAPQLNGRKRRETSGWVTGGRSFMTR
ncbi:MAG TPA: acetyl-CoA carboxylase biotin carboxylase subunit [Bryobacteraceae bacterium]|nr:acetyl-CoA carboxylase biotin carboxylase subunit [Bryobacteraceae bacterium]